MSNVKLGLSGLNGPALMLKGLHIAESLTGNLFFPTPTPTLIELAASLDALSASIEAAQTGDHEKIAMRNIRMGETKEVLKQLGMYVQDESKGNAEKIISSGFEVAQRGGPIGPLPAPGNAAAKVGNAMGTIDLSWDKVVGSRVFMIEINTTDPMNEVMWVARNYSTKTHFTVSGLTTGTVCWFRIKPIGVAGVGAGSDPARSVVP
jgi:hypothetical protein